MQTPPKPILSLKGYVTIWKVVRNKKPSQVERVLGFGTSTLKDGYLVYALAGKIAKLKDFEWKDRTIFADGWRPDPSVDLGDGKVWKVEVSDHLRAIFFKYSGYNEAKAESMFIQSRNEQLAHLNTRSGPRRIVKVIPAVGNASGTYPDSKVKNIPQWRLKKAKKFVLIEVAEPDRRG